MALTGGAGGSKQKPSKDDMQCYLLSHVLYDGQKTVANPKKEPDWLDTLDEDLELEKGMLEDEYIKEMERYLALFDSDDKKSKKKSKIKKKGTAVMAAKDEPTVKLVTVEVSDLKKRFEVKRNDVTTSFGQKASEQQASKIDLIMEPNVDKFKEMFEAQNAGQDLTEDGKLNANNVPARRPGRLLNSDLLKKFDSPEMAEELKRQREKEREERRLQRIAKLEEDKRKADEERKRIEDEFMDQCYKTCFSCNMQLLSSFVEGNEQANLSSRHWVCHKHNRLPRGSIQPASPSAKELRVLVEGDEGDYWPKWRREQERLEALRKEEEERVMREEEEIQRKMDEERAKTAYEEMMKLEKEKAAMREVREAKTREQREKNEPAFKKRKVLDRIQHVFEKNMAEDGGQSKKTAKVGSVRGKADEMFNKDDVAATAGSGRKNFQDSSLSGISSVLNKVKDRFEVKDEGPVSISHGVSIKKKNIPAAETFAMMELKQQKESLNAAKTSSANNEDWSWKKKDPKQLAVESTIAMYGPSKDAAPKKSDREKRKAEQQQKLLSDIKTLNSRFVKRDAIKEHEEKMKEFADFMSDIQDYLLEPVNSNEERDFKDDNFIELAAASANKKKQEKKKKTSLEKIKPEPFKMGSIAEIKKKLAEQTSSSNNNNNPELSKGPNDVSSLSIAQLRDSLTQKLEVRGQNSYQSKLFEAQGSAEVTKIRDIFEAESNLTEEVVDTKSSYEWKYKKKSIAELQKFLSSHVHLVPASVSKTLSAVEKNLSFVPVKEITEESDEMNDELNRFDDYSEFMEKVDEFLSAPDHSGEEIEFKAEIEKYLDLIEEPANEEEVRERKKIFGTASVISRRPQKLNLTLFGFEKSRDDVDQDESLLTLRPQQKDKKMVREIQMKLASDSMKDSPKEGVVVHTVGTSRLTNQFEKLNRVEEISLISAPKIVPKKTPEEMAADVMNVTLNKDKGSSNWKWKEKEVTDLYKYVKDNYEVVPSALVEQQKALQARETSIEEKRSELIRDSSLRSVEALKRLEEEREKDLDLFLNDVQLFLGKSSNTSQRSTKSLKREQRVEAAQITKDKNFDLAGNVSSIRTLLENSGPEFDDKSEDKPKIGKVKTDFLVQKDRETSSSKFVDPVVSSLDANRIKSKLVNQYFKQNDEPKTLFSAPKTKLQNFIPTEDKISAASELGGLLRQSRSSATKKTGFSGLEKPVLKPDPKAGKDLLPRPEVFEYKPTLVPETRKSPEATYKSPYAQYQDEESRKAAILAKYGVKPRPIQNCSSSSSSLNSEEDEMEIAKTINEQKKQLKEAYGLNDIKERLREKKMAKENAANSLNSLKTVLTQIRSTRIAQSHGSRLNLEECTSDNSIYNSDLDLSELKGTCSNTRAVFERLSRDADQARGHVQPVERSATFSNVKTLFDATDSPAQQSPRHSGLYKPVSNRSFSNVKSVFENCPAEAGSVERPSNVFSPANRSGLEKSSSFHKFVGAFESGQKIRHHHDEDDDNGDDGSDSENDFSDSDSDEDQVKFRRRILSNNAGSQKSLIQAELEEIRSNSRLQSVFRINRPASGSSRPSLNSRFGSSSENLDLDDKTLKQVSSTRSAMKSLFESTAPKVTFGGAAAFGADKATPVAKPVKPKAPESSARSWMFEVINKYFDVIAEDEEGSDNDGDDDDEDENVAEHEPVFASQVSTNHRKYRIVESNERELSIEPVVEREEEEDQLEDDPDEDEAGSEAGDNDVDEEEDDQNVGRNYGLTKSASSSRMRTLFRSVIQRNASGGDLSLDNFKANLGTHLRLRGSTQSLVAPGHPSKNQDYDTDDEYQENERFIRVRL